MSNVHTPTVVIIGAGLAGISAAIGLKTQLNFDNFVIYEKANAVGGTWRENTYPGCGSDVPGHWYSLSTELNPSWSSYYVGQPEIQAYWVNLWHKYKLESRTKFGHLVKYAEWDATMQRYHLKIENLATGETIESDAEIIFFAIGGFIAPVYPKDIQGINSFHGDLWHSAKWNRDVDLKGKRVGVIGNGCSAAQIIPEISKDPSTTVVNFVRTPQWYSPRPNTIYPAWLQWVFANVPLVMRLHRNIIMARADLSFMVFRNNNKINKILIRGARRGFITYIERMAPKKYLDKLIPPFSVGCKRIIVDPGYLECLHQPNVDLRWESIDCIVQEGIKLKTGEIVPLDVIIFGTGFSLVTTELTIRGSKGLTFAEFNEQNGGAAAYLGTCRPGFQSVPSAGTKHRNGACIGDIYGGGPGMEKAWTCVKGNDISGYPQINYAVQMVKAIIDNRAKSFEVKEKACSEYDNWLQRRMSTSVWTECNSFYHIGNDKNTKNVAVFPGPVTLFWWMLRRPRWEDYDVIEGTRGMRRREWLWVAAAAVAAAVGTVVGYL